MPRYIIKELLINIIEMSETREEKATGLIKEIGVFLGLSANETKETETKETVALEETTEETKEEVKFASELAEGDYELVDGTKFRIDAEGNLVDVVAPSADEAETEEAAKDEEKENLKQEMAKQVKKIEELEEANTKLSEVKAVSGAPKKSVKAEPIQLTSNMNSEQKQAARRHNRNLNK